MAEQLLDCPDVVTGLKEVRGERMPECVAPGMLDHTGPADRILDGSLQNRLVNVMPPFFARLRVFPPGFLRKDPLPAPPCGAAPLLAETIPAAARIDDGERSLTCDRQEVLVSRDQQIGIAIDRRRKHPPVIRIANGKR